MRFLTGKGRYTDDINVAGQAHVVFLRSDVAHGKIVSLDTTAAEAMEGVIRSLHRGGFRGGRRHPLRLADHLDRRRRCMQEPKHPILAEGKVRHVGDPIAAVVAETPAQARDACEAIVVEIEELPAVIDMKAALAEGRAQGA